VLEVSSVVDYSSQRRAGLNSNPIPDIINTAKSKVSSVVVTSPSIAEPGVDVIS
jgi:hypothetical protein